MTLPSSLYQHLITKLVVVLDLVQQSEGITTPQAKQALLHATNDFRNAVATAKRLALDLPGGELVVREQDEIIMMLTQLRDGKRRQLHRFFVAAEDDNMDLDSAASTP
ncbi:uncharacterized protein BT62DRAFT_538245 [Guyanagaster necrorhizus]|uniref:Mediator of RNA polymerase II transcription subunit 9 n=1 Tax=Guyanagaster necrorhizus TaxID=856835 RepID=A0A9P8AYE1_9AGAR|nr:uncharacterized protein BT62DRAFT_538245 [Guyanagaster necrorhizus MCA 3950]KAG7450832.1 hypothetical protein BT62DRAFT_538245 [Guyanagaster necrorhizus MCA 3950]